MDDTIIIFMSNMGILVCALDADNLAKYNDDQGFRAKNVCVVGRNPAGIGMMPVVPWHTKGSEIYMEFRPCQVVANIPTDGASAGLVKDYQQMFSPIDLSAAQGGTGNVIELARG